YQITFDGKKMLVKIKKDYAIIDVPKDKLETKDHEHKIEGLDMQLDRHAEWRQIYFECWRHMRDFFFSPTMNGVDWKAMRDKYAALLPYVNHRNDLTYLLGELIGELNNGHTYVAGGELGYLHIPDMGRPGLDEFTKLYFPQIRKHALIVDVRGNGGGFVSPLVIERLRRALVMIGIARNGMPQTDPPQTFTGPMVTLINEFSASDGDIFPYRFKTLGLGKLIGKRTWGGVIGIRESLPLVDGGQFFKPEFAPYSKDGKQWIVEGRGVDPDIIVDSDPGREVKGEGQQ